MKHVSLERLGFGVHRQLRFRLLQGFGQCRCAKAVFQARVNHRPDRLGKIGRVHALWAATRSAPYRVACRGPMLRGWPLCPERTGRAIRWRTPRSSSSHGKPLCRVFLLGLRPGMDLLQAPAPSQTGRCGSSCRMSWRTRALQLINAAEGWGFQAAARFQAVGGLPRLLGAFLRGCPGGRPARVRSKLAPCHGKCDHRRRQEARVGRRHGARATRMGRQRPSQKPRDRKNLTTAPGMFLRVPARGTSRVSFTLPTHNWPSLGTALFSCPVLHIPCIPKSRPKALFSLTACDYWWSRSGSNRRPRHCERRALPTELRPRWRATWRQTPLLSSRTRRVLPSASATCCFTARKLSA